MLEELIKDLTAAIRENTAAVNQCIATAGGTPAATTAPLAALPDPAPAKAPAKGKKAAAAPEPEAPAAEPEPEVPAAEEDGPATPAMLQPIRDAYTAGSKATGDLAAFKAAFAALRTEYQITVITDLKASEVEGFLAKLKAL